MGEIEIPTPEYGYLLGILLLREKIDYKMYSDWVGRELEELAYTDSHGGNVHGVAFICQLRRRACRYRMKYARWIVAKGDTLGRLAELQIY